MYVSGSIISMDTTGSAFANYLRGIITEILDKVEVLTLLIDLYFAESNVNAFQLEGVLNRAFNRAKLQMHNTIAFLSDGSSVNTSAFKNLVEDVDLKNTITILCLSHLMANGGKELAYPMVAKFNLLVSKVFSRSDNAKVLYEKLMGKAFNGGSGTRWFNKLLMDNRILSKLQSFINLVVELIHRGFSTANAGKLFRMLDKENN